MQRIARHHAPPVRAAHTREKVAHDNTSRGPVYLLLPVAPGVGTRGRSARTITSIAWRVLYGLLTRLWVWPLIMKAPGASTRMTVCPSRTSAKNRSKGRVGHGGRKCKAPPSSQPMKILARPRGRVMFCRATQGPKGRDLLFQVARVSTSVTSGRPHLPGPKASAL